MDWDWLARNADGNFEQAQDLFWRFGWLGWEAGNTPLNPLSRGDFVGLPGLLEDFGGKCNFMQEISFWH